MREYEKPSITLETEMLFTKEIWEEFSEGNWCFGCTNCNCNQPIEAAWLMILNIMTELFLAICEVRFYNENN